MDEALPAITAVLVLYRLRANESACFGSLRAVFEAEPALAHDFSLLLYDNSPESQVPPDFRATLRYQHDGKNGGLASAYNAGLDQARRDGSPWLLLLDQDTALTREYVEELRRLAGTVPSQAVAIVPRLTHDGRTLSPRDLPRLSHNVLPESLTGLLSKEVCAFNSGAAIRVGAISRFPERYWLDFLDYAVFRELHAAGGRVWLMKARLPHRLSTDRLGSEASLARYLNMLRAERDFYRNYGSFIDKLFYRLRRVKQTAGHLIKVRDKRFALLSARAALGLLDPKFAAQTRKWFPPFRDSRVDRSEAPEAGVPKDRFTDRTPPKH